MLLLLDTLLTLLGAFVAFSDTNALPADTVERISSRSAVLVHV